MRLFICQIICIADNDLTRIMSATGLDIVHAVIITVLFRGGNSYLCTEHGLSQSMIIKLYSSILT